MTKKGNYLSTLIMCYYLISNCKEGERVNKELNSIFGQISPPFPFFRFHFYNSLIFKRASSPINPLKI